MNSTPKESPSVNDSAPALTVLMPVHNCEDFICSAIESVLQQSWKDFELLVIDDGSTDQTLTKIQGFYDPRMRIVSGPHLGFVEQLNRGLEMARSKIIVRMDGDDISHVDRFEKQLTFMTEHPGVSVVSSAYRLIDRAGNELEVKYLPEKDEGIRELMPVFTAICHSGAMYRKLPVLSVGGYRTEYRHVEDVDLWLRLMPLVTFGNLQDILLSVRLHNKSTSFEHFQVQQRLQAKVCTEYLERERENARTPKDLFAVRLQMALTNYYHGSMKIARPLFIELLVQSPWNLKLWRFLLVTFLGNRMLSFLRRKGWTKRATSLFRKDQRSMGWIAP